MHPPSNWQHQQQQAFQPSPSQPSTNKPQHFFQPPPVQSYSQQNQIPQGLSNARPPPPIVPMDKFQASSAFEKNTTTDGWDDWDWNDTSNNNNRQQIPTQQHQAVINHQHQAQQQGSVATNQSFPGPPLPQQYATQQQGSMVTNQSFPGPPLHQHQPQQPQQQPHYSHPPPPAPHQQYQKQPVSQPSNVIDSFADNANWNWNQQPSDASNSSVLDNAASLFETVPKKSVVNHSRNVSAGSNQDFALTSAETSAIPTRLDENIESRPPDDINNTQFVNPALKRVIKSEHQLTPQWSIESQMSHTSSERSGESDALDSRSTNTSDEQQYEHHVHQGSTNYSAMITSGFVHENECDQLGYTQVESRVPAQHTSDSLDEALHSLNINQSNASNVSIEDSAAGQQQPVSNWQKHNFSLTPMAMPPVSLPSTEDSFNPASHNPNVNYSTPANSSSSNTLVQNNLSSAQGNVEQIAPPPTNIAFVPTLQTLPKQSYQFPPAPTVNQSNSLPTAGNSSNNPFKRTSAQKIATFPVPPVSTANYYQPPSTVSPAAIDANQEQHENSETPDTTSYYQRNTEVENQEIAPHNDRNEYLQTGHLSEDGYGSTSGQLYQADGTENFPPPGLSRLVLGQPESSSTQTNNQPEPPRGLNRMVPGTDLSNSTHLNLERQADGQDTVTPAIVRLPNFSMPPPPVNVPQQPIDIPQTNLITTDRNLYLVPGDESDAHTQQRVVTGGLEQQQQVQQPIASQQRELVMDGENLEDEQQQQLQQPQIYERDEPIEGANMLDDAQSTGLNLTESEVNVNADGSKKFTSNPSTCNDDSDKDRQSYFNRSSNRRSEESARRRRGGEKAADRYETEESDYFSDRDKGKRRLNRDGREGSVRRDKGIPADSGNRERDALRDQREGRVINRSSRDDRDRNTSKRDSERYRRGNDNDKYEPDRDKYIRYETDGSRYETEDSRYDRQPRRNRGEFDGRRDDAEKKYRRSDRGTDGRKRGEIFDIIYLNVGIVQYFNQN